MCVSHSLRLKILLLFKVQQSLEKISKLEQEKEHWMLEAQLARIKLEKENQRMADRLRSASVVQLAQEEGAAKVPAEPLQSTSLVSVLLLALACLCLRPSCSSPPPKKTADTAGGWEVQELVSLQGALPGSLSAAFPVK